MKYQLIIAVSLSTLMLQACNAGSGSTRPVSPQQTAVDKPQAPVTTALSKNQKYADLLKQLEQRNPATEAQQAMSRGKPYLLGYYSGRAGLKLPGVSSEQQATQRCSLTTIDGLGDVIYGENHLRYRIAMRNFAKDFNTQMLSACL